MSSKSNNLSHTRGLFAAVLISVTSLVPTMGTAAVTDPSLYTGTSADHRANEVSHPVYFTKGPGAPIALGKDNGRDGYARHPSAPAGHD